MVALRPLHLFLTAAGLPAVAGFAPPRPISAVSPRGAAGSADLQTSTSTSSLVDVPCERRRGGDAALSSVHPAVGRSGGARYAATSKLHAASTSADKTFPARRERALFEIRTLIRVLLPAILAGVAAFAAMPALCHRISVFVTRVTHPAQIGMLNDAVASFVGLIGLLYSILVGQVFGFLYSQQEALYYALFDEVTEAKSLLEQVALVSQGRTMYSTCLDSIARYVRDDLLGGTSGTAPTGKGNNKTPSTPSVTPSLILSARPADDPLEAILYLTSVGVPGGVYDTVRSLRQARARRLGALQRKVPAIHLIMLGILGVIMTLCFPVLVGVGGAAAAGGKLYAEAFPWAGYKVMTLQGGLFGVAAFAMVMTKAVLGELWRTRGGAYNVDSTLKVMVRGLQKELEERRVEAKRMLKRSKAQE